jgi:hypothetical protein
MPKWNKMAKEKLSEQSDTDAVMVPIHRKLNNAPMNDFIG